MRLGVNIDHIATVRQQRRGRFPDPIEAAAVCERHGASGIVCHLREDRRHIQDEDVRRLKQSVTTSLNLEMAISNEIVEMALALVPNQVTLVPEKRQELTTEGGLNVKGLLKRLTGLIPRFKERGIAVSLFVDPDISQVEASHKVGANSIELHTGRFAQAKTDREREGELQSVIGAANEGRTRGMLVAAGHGLEYDNVAAVARIPEIEELNIGYSIIVRALEVGLGAAVREMVEKIGVETVHAKQE